MNTNYDSNAKGHRALFIFDFGNSDRRRFESIAKFS